jgi:hypothetical protein
MELTEGWEVLDIAISADNAKFASVGGDRAVYVPCRIVIYWLDFCGMLLLGRP